ncbi:MAG: hypothetical protein HRU15_20610 [Planctomycetes bacterium]|nr:hypothetical protein [Planctomycetota bacterium]
MRNIHMIILSVCCLSFITSFVVLSAAGYSLEPGASKLPNANKMAQRMAAEIVEQTAQNATVYRATLMDLAKSLRAGQMTVAQARDILSLAASSRQLVTGTVRPKTIALAQQDMALDKALGAPEAAQPDQATAVATAVATASPTTGVGSPDYSPEELDLDSMLIDKPKSKRRSNLFKSSQPQPKVQSYAGGIAGEVRSWEKKQTLPKAEDPRSNVDIERERVAGKAKDLGRSQNGEIGKAQNIAKVNRVFLGTDGLPQMVLVSAKNKNAFRKDQTLLVHRDSKALVKVVITNQRGDYEAFALVMPDTWAEGAERTLKPADKVQGL